MKIEITLNENLYAIEVDGNCFTAIKYDTVKDIESKNFGNIKETQLGYFNKLTNAALRLCREEISTSPDTVSLKEFASRIEAINKQLSDQLETVLV